MIWRLILFMVVVAVPRAWAVTSVTFSCASVYDTVNCDGIGASYPPSFTLCESAQIDTNKSVFSGSYHVNASLMRWDTSSLPDDATITDAWLEFWIGDGQATSDDSRAFQCEWYTHSDWTQDEIDNDGLANYTVGSISTATSIAVVDILDTGGTPNSFNQLVLANPDANVSRTALTALRCTISGDQPGGPPAFNEVTLGGFGIGGGTGCDDLGPFLHLEYETGPTPTAPPNTHTETPTFTPTNTPTPTPSCGFAPAQVVYYGTTVGTGSAMVVPVPTAIPDHHTLVVSLASGAGGCVPNGSGDCGNNAPAAPSDSAGNSYPFFYGSFGGWVSSLETSGAGAYIAPNIHGLAAGSAITIPLPPGGPAIARLYDFLDVRYNIGTCVLELGTVSQSLCSSSNHTCNTLPVYNPINPVPVDQSNSFGWGFCALSGDVGQMLDLQTGMTLEHDVIEDSILGIDVSRMMNPPGEIMWGIYGNDPEAHPPSANGRCELVTFLSGCAPPDWCGQPTPPTPLPTNTPTATITAGGPTLTPTETPTDTPTNVPTWTPVQVCKTWTPVPTGCCECPLSTSCLPNNGDQCPLGCVFVPGGVCVEVPTPLPTATPPPTRTGSPTATFPGNPTVPPGPPTWTPTRTKTPTITMTPTRTPTQPTVTPTATPFGGFPSGCCLGTGSGCGNLQPLCVPGISQAACETAIQFGLALTPGCIATVWDPNCENSNCGWVGCCSVSAECRGGPACVGNLRPDQCLSLNLGVGCVVVPGPVNTDCVDSGTCHAFPLTPGPTRTRTPTQATPTRTPTPLGTPPTVTPTSFPADTCCECQNDPVCYLSFPARNCQEGNPCPGGGTSIVHFHSVCVLHFGNPTTSSCEVPTPTP